MSPIVTRCSVLERHAVEPADRAANGTVTDDAVRRWVGRALAAYLDQCTLLQQARLEHGLTLVDDVVIPAPVASLGDPSAVAVGASATEVLPDAFVVAVRIRGGGGEDDGVLHATCTVRLEDPDTHVARAIGDDIRDELIALEHAARHFN
jgi:hypothetical protein